MSKFTAPTWDVDGSANILCDKFSGGQKSFKGKKAPKKKRNKQNDMPDKDVRKKFKTKVSGPGSNIHSRQLTQEKSSSHVRMRTKSVKKRMKRGEKFEGNVNSGVFANRKTGGDKSVGEQQKLVKKNVSHGNKSNRAQPPRTLVKSESFTSQKKNKEKKNLQFPKVQGGFKSKKKFDLKSSKQKLTSGKQNQQNSFETQSNGDISVNNTNKRIRKRKRNSIHLTDSRSDVQSTKKRKLVNVIPDQQIEFSSQKQVSKGKNIIKQTYNKPNKNFKSTGRKVNSNSSNLIRNNNINMNKNEMNFKNLSTEKNNEHTSSQSSVEQSKQKIDNTQTSMKSPYFGKSRFYDSSLSLRERMLLQLKSSRFRYINEQLYTSDSKDAEDMLKKDPDLFKVYHDGFKQQVEQWPVNPVEKIVKAIQRKPADLIVADFGCGDAKLAKSLPNKVHSFDLVALSEEITVCDMAHTPLKSESVDICVFCLSLMGTNLGSYLVEANRVLKNGGTLKIAEVASRFASVEQFMKDLKKYGYSLISKDLSHDLFYFLNFQKDSNIKNVKSLPNLSLNPCWYKKR